MQSDAEQKLIERYDLKKAEIDSKWQNELALLERRVQTNYVDIDIGDGDTIAIRASISEKEIIEIAANEKKKLSYDKEKDLDEINTLTYRNLAIITANPLMTEEFFAENKDKFSTEDMLKVILGYYDTMLERAKRMQAIESFRKK